MLTEHINEGWVVLKTLQAFAKQNQHIVELWISADAIWKQISLRHDYVSR